MFSGCHRGPIAHRSAKIWETGIFKKTDLCFIKNQSAAATYFDFELKVSISYHRKKWPKTGLRTSQNGHVNKQHSMQNNPILSKDNCSKNSIFYALIIILSVLFSMSTYCSTNLNSFTLIRDFDFSGHLCVQQFHYLFARVCVCVFHCLHNNVTQ